MGRPIADIKRELIYLEYQYNLLKVKTVDYNELKEKLEKELAKEVKAVNDGNAKQLQGYKPSKRESFRSRLSDPFESSKNPQSIQAEDEYQSDIKASIRR
jgi:hypothetical protein